MGWSSQLFAGVSLPPYLQKTSEKGRVSCQGNFPAVLWVCWLCDLHNPEALVARAACNGLCKIWGQGLQVWPRGPGGEGGEGVATHMAVRDRSCSRSLGFPLSGSCRSQRCRASGDVWCPDR